jgi:hypothetical protein
MSQDSKQLQRQERGRRESPKLGLSPPSPLGAAFSTHASVREGCLSYNVACIRHLKKQTEEKQFQDKHVSSQCSEPLCAVSRSFHISQHISTHAPIPMHSQVCVHTRDVPMTPRAGPETPKHAPAPILTPMHRPRNGPAGQSWDRVKPLSLLSLGPRQHSWNPQVTTLAFICLAPGDV